jgi:hypothetical protein
MATAEERAHFERVAAAKRAQDADQLREELARPAMERLLEGLVLGEAAATSAAIERALDERALGQADLHRRARRLGLLR